MKIRIAKREELDVIDSVYADAREFMRASGNPNQWKDGYPCRDLLISDIENGNLYVCEGEDGEIMGVFYYRSGDDPTYLSIYNGGWKNSLPYGVIHRIAVSKNARGKGVARACFDYAYKICGNVKIDTHASNIPMQKALLKYGFEKCGIIYLSNGDERIAFQKGNRL